MLTEGLFPLQDERISVSGVLGPQVSAFLL